VFVEELPSAEPYTELPICLAEPYAEPAVLLVVLIDDIPVCPHIGNGTFSTYDSSVMP